MVTATYCQLFTEGGGVVKETESAHCAPVYDYFLIVYSFRTFEKQEPPPVTGSDSFPLYYFLPLTSYISHLPSNIIHHPSTLFTSSSSLRSAAAPRRSSA